MSGKQATVWIVTESDASETLEVAGGRTRERRCRRRFRRGRGAAGAQEPDPARAGQRRRSEAADRRSRHGGRATCSTTPAPSPGLQLDLVELSVEISSEGQVSILGSGGKLGGKGGLKLTFRPPPWVRTSA